MKIAFHSSKKPRAQKALEELKGKYGNANPAEAEAIVVIGGDGTMLRALRSEESRVGKEWRSRWTPYN